MERPRFSGKELLKNAKTEFVIPKDYTELTETNKVAETPKAFLLTFKVKTRSYNTWLPKEFVVLNKDKYYCANWLLKIN